MILTGICQHILRELNISITKSKRVKIYIAALDYNLTYYANLVDKSQSFLGKRDELLLPPEKKRPSENDLSAPEQLVHTIAQNSDGVSHVLGTSEHTFDEQLFGGAWIHTVF